MKTTADLFELLAIAVEQNSNEGTKNWFFNYYGHVNLMKVTFYFTGWSVEGGVGETLEEKIDDGGIQALYWFVSNRL